MISYQSLILQQIQKYVTEKLQYVDAGHDMTHIYRVLENAKRINEIEKGDGFLIEAGVLLHDITDDKLFDKTTAEEQLQFFFKEIDISDDVSDVLFDIINSVSFGREIDVSVELSLEQKIIRDADRLDAIGAIGIARTFHYGGSKNRELFNSNIPPQVYQSTEEYRKSNAPTINHFYEKLLLLKDRMETQTGKQLAQERHDYMLGFLKQFYFEIGETGFRL